jgi:hypothetical protein
MYTQERPGGPGIQVLTMRRFLIGIVTLVALPMLALAQRGGGAGHAAASAPHASMGMHFSPSVGTHFASPAIPSYAAAGHIPSSYAIARSRAAATSPAYRIVRSRSGALVVRPTQRLNNPARNISGDPARSGRALLSRDTVPGLGFDYAHLAAVHPGGIRGRGRDRDRNGRFIGAYFPFFGGGYYLPIYPDDIDDTPAVDAQQQVDAGAAGGAQTADNEYIATPSQDYVPAPEKEAEQYVFVRRDGTLFFAVAYSWDNGTLRYITNEGLKRSVTGDKLDLGATQQFNEQRGLNFHLPA